MDEGNDNSGSGIGRNNVCKDDRKVLVLALLSDLYSKLEAISVSASEPSSCPTLYYLLTIYRLLTTLRELYMILT